MDLTQILLQSLGNGGVEQIGERAGLNSQQTSSAMAAVVPTLLSALARNTTTEQGATGLLSALDRDHDGSILDDIGGFLSNPDSMNGGGILKHVLGNDQSQVEEGLASKLGINAGSIAKLLPIIAPMVMAYLGKQKRETPASTFQQNDVTSILTNLAGGSNQSNGIDMSSIMNLLGGLSGGKSQSGGGLLDGLLKNVLKG
jgi:hypothetical protein